MGYMGYMYSIIKDYSFLQVFSKKFICEAIRQIRYDIGQFTKALIEVYLALF